MERKGIFIKVFSYTIIVLLLLVGVTATLFAQQFVSYFRVMELQQTVKSYQPLVELIQNSDRLDIQEVAGLFHYNNQSFEFYIEDKEGSVLYATPNADTSNSVRPDFLYVVHRDDNISIVAQSKAGVGLLYQGLTIRGIVMIAIMVVFSLLCAYIFARQMTTPIKALADSANKMANLKEVPPPLERKDELGALAHDMHSMYIRLKETIARLEDEIAREHELEETQRYFFAAASHELKTPIAAVSVLLEGMLENIGDYKDHSKYLRECIKMMDRQGKTISEILELVSLNDGRIVPIAEPLDIGRTVAELLPDFQTLAEANNQRFVTDIPAGQIVLSDPKLIQKALSNVILNAVQNTPQGGEVRIWSEPGAEKCRLFVLNMGVHIDDTALPRLFTPFYRIDQARSRKSGRSGLGLAIVQKTLDAMSLQYALENTSDGVLFWLDLPLTSTL